MDLDLNINIINKDKYQNIKILRDNCFENYLSEVIKNIKLKKIKYYQSNMIKDEHLRLKIISK